MVIAIFVNRAYQQYARGNNLDHPKKMSVSELLALSGHSPIIIITTPNFGPFSRKLGGTVRAIKKMTQNDNGPGLGRIYRETAVFTFT